MTTASQRKRARVPDVTTPEFKAEAHRQSLAVAQSAGEAEGQAFIDAIAAELDDEDMVALNQAIIVFLGLAAGARRRR